MKTLRETLQELCGQPFGSILLEDASGGEWLPGDLLKVLDSDDEGKHELARTAMRVHRTEDELDSVIAFVSSDGYEYPHEPRWYVIRPRNS